MLVKQHADNADDDQPVRPVAHVVGDLAQIQVESKARKDDHRRANQTKALAKRRENEVRMGLGNRDDVGLQALAGQPRAA